MCPRPGESRSKPWNDAQERENYRSILSIADRDTIRHYLFVKTIYERVGIQPDSRLIGANATTLGQFVDELQSRGRYTFTKNEAQRALECSDEALKKAAYRLAAKRRLVAPRRGFFVIVPLEYRSAGAPPASWFIDDLMRFHGRPYYVGLLTAAALHGAAHEQPQEFQVMTDVALRPTVAGRSRIRFFLKRFAARTPVGDVKTQTGSMHVSTPEATAFDVVRYADAAGGIGNVATVLAELAETLNAKRLVDVAKTDDVELAVVQRTGFLLELAHQEMLTSPLAAWLEDQRPRFVALRPDLPTEDAAKNERWLVTVNDEIEIDT